MVERFLVDFPYIDIPEKYLLLAHAHFLSVFALKIVLKIVHTIDVSPIYVTSVVARDIGKRAMKLASKVALDGSNSETKDLSPIGYLKEDTKLSDKSNVCIGSGEPLSSALHSLVVDK